MGKIIAGLASSHAYALQEPERWDMMRQRTMERYKARYGNYPPLQPKVAQETPETREQRYVKIRHGLSVLKQNLAAQKPDALILVGDDQDENFSEENLPQIAIYIGGEFALNGAYQPEGAKRLRYRSHTGLATDLLHSLVRREFDVGYIKKLPNDILLSHAHCQILARMLPEAEIPVVLVFVNAIHVPAPTPARCYRLGEAIRSIVEARVGAERLVIYGSGGLSHFTSGYPWEHYKGNHNVGAICEAFDRELIDFMAAGKGQKLGQLSSEDLLMNGEIELRSWITVLGAVGDVRPDLIAYEPFYSGVMGMGVAYWTPHS
jgi:aromatic ring-opening dioxygenase catalytic subunit (LigB family)